MILYAIILKLLELEIGCTRQSTVEGHQLIRVFDYMCEIYNSAPLRVSNTTLAESSIYFMHLNGHCEWSKVCMVISCFILYSVL